MTLGFWLGLHNEMLFKEVISSFSKDNQKLHVSFISQKITQHLSPVTGLNVFFRLMSCTSNPLSLKSAIQNFDKINSNNQKKYLLLGDMLELGKHSKKLHESIAPIINRTNIYKVFVKGKEISLLYNKISNFKWC